MVKSSYRIEEVAAIRGQSYNSVRLAIARGEIAALRVGARGVRIPASEGERLTGTVETQLARKAATAGSVA